MSGWIHEGSDTARLLAFAEVCSRYLADRAAQTLADALERYCTDALTADLDDIDDADVLVAGRARLTDEAVQRWSARLAVLRADGVTATFVCDHAYPANLRMVFNRPPVLFYRGDLTPRDGRAVAVVGTRAASSDGLNAATRIAGYLADHGVTVVSGLARGIDTAAHASAIRSGGRTIAVLGQGLSCRLPVARAGLAHQIERRGALVSQWWPEQPVTRWTLPIRNIVTSGLSTATIVVEAGESSGARLQANDALKHGKRVYLVRELVGGQSWARDLLDSGVARGVDLDTLDQIIEGVDLDSTMEPTIFA